MSSVSVLMKISILVSIIVLTGCGTGKIVSVGKDTYMVTGYNSAPFSSGAAVLTDLYEEAGRYCIKSNKKLVPVKSDYNNHAPGRPSRAELTFRCLLDNDPEYLRPGIDSVPNTNIGIISK